MRILFVDDEPSIRELFEISFSDDYELVLADNGQSAYEICMDQKIDLIITDISLPKLSGVEFIRKLKDSQKFIPFIIITGNSNIDLAIDTFRMGAVDFFLKPFRIDNLREVIEKAKMVHVDKRAHVPSDDFVHETENSLYLLNPKIREINQYVSYIAGRLDALPNVGNEDLIAIKVSLYELISNAIEHGTAGIDYSQKKEFLEHSGDYFNLVDNKCLETKKKIRVTTFYKNKSIEIEVEDEGLGFDLKNIPDPIKNPSYNLYSGRGIFLTKLNVDDIKYNDIGNIVRITRLLTSQ
ncbi:MAG: response regulator [Leptospira sp.]|nr:response regulator [Leptospira sp.]NCS92905.1 response regulator [Leptospira sp.]